jgi:hypothetical protein
MAAPDLPNISAAAARMRRHRQRRHDRLRCLRIELRETEIDELIRRKLLTPETRNDPNAVLRAFYGFLDHALARGGDAQRPEGRRINRDSIDDLQK